MKCDETFFAGVGYATSNSELDFGGDVDREGIFTIAG